MVLYVERPKTKFLKHLRFLFQTHCFAHIAQNHQTCKQNNTGNKMESVPASSSFLFAFRRAKGHVFWGFECDLFRWMIWSSLISFSPTDYIFFNIFYIMHLHAPCWHSMMSIVPLLRPSVLLQPFFSPAGKWLLRKTQQTRLSASSWLHLLEGSKRGVYASSAWNKCNHNISSLYQAILFPALFPPASSFSSASCSSNVWSAKP